MRRRNYARDHLAAAASGRGASNEAAPPMQALTRRFEAQLRYRLGRSAIQGRTARLRVPVLVCMIADDGNHWTNVEPAPAKYNDRFDPGAAGLPMRVTAIIAAAGAGSRFGTEIPKQLLDIGGKSMLARSVAAFDEHPAVADLIVVLPPDLAAAGAQMVGPTRRPVRIVPGGGRRQDSVAEAFDAVGADTDIVLVHDAARPFVSRDVISRAIDAAAAHGAAIAAVRATDTIKRVDRRPEPPVILETLTREEIYLAQTPQAFRREILRDAVALGRSGVDATDEAALAERAGHPVRVIEGDPANVKITTPSDLESVRHRQSADGTSGSMRVGTGYDLHRLVQGRPLILGGVTVPATLGAYGHSDADVVCHAAIDALLGAAGLGDIGSHFPDTDARWEGVSSIELVRTTAAAIRHARYEIVNLDVVVILERPKIAPFLSRIRAGLAGALEIAVEGVSVKGKTNEGIDALGRGEAVAAHAVALLAAQ
jgi:2-C-methyl-D-erythritol 4-phosphate cytidylyltransferase/2-C-methyl-D-erythritol 2,4-cyclodiphosphate synthase